MLNAHSSQDDKKHENIRDSYIQYGLPYRRSSNSSNFDYYRSCSSSSSSGSGKILVHRPYFSPYSTSKRYNPIYKEESTPTNITSLNSETDRSVGKFHIGSHLRIPPTPELSQNGFYVTQIASPGLLTVPQYPGLEETPNIVSSTILPDSKETNSLTHPANQGGSVNETFWQIPRANLWCSHKDGANEGNKCFECDLKDETTSNCSSENPPPTFTALDNIHPVKRRKRWCKCAITCLTTTTFCFLVMSIIAGYILYVEVVLKRNQYVPEPM